MQTKKTAYIFLDDIRDPKYVYEFSYKDADWKVYRSVAELKYDIESIIEENDEVVLSFDHHLGTKITGCDYLEKLIHLHHYGRIDLSKVVFKAHTSDSTARDRMRKLWEEFEKTLPLPEANE